MNHPYTFQIGKFSCSSISDGGLNYPVEMFFRGLAVAEAEHILSENRLPTTYVHTPYTLLYVETPSHKILIDTGLGRYGETVGKVFPGIDNSTTNPGQFLRNFQRSHEVDMVIITHAHADHVGANVNEHGQLNFPNASYFISREEWDFWFSDERTASVRPPQNVAIARTSLEPIRDRVTLLDMDAEIIAGIRFIPAPGHTPGHVVVLLESEEEQLIHISDTVLHPLHLEHPELGVVFDYHTEQTDKSKRYICDLAADNKMFVFAHHFPPFPNLGYIKRTSTGWRWLPVDTE